MHPYSGTTEMLKTLSGAIVTYSLIAFDLQTLGNGGISEFLF